MHAVMYIPTQAERYSKKSLVTLILCVIAPSAVYAYLLSSQVMVPVDSIMGMLNMILFCTYPLALALLAIGLPFWLGVSISFLAHAAAVWAIYRQREWSGKKMVAWAISLGMIDLFILKIINTFPPGSVD